MRIKALLSTLILGSTLAGVASASPMVRDHRYEPAPVRYRAPVNYGYQVTANNTVIPYTYGNDPCVKGIARNEWMTLARGLRLPYGSESQISIRANGQPLRSIELQATAGSNYIRAVHVELNDGREITLPTDRTVRINAEPNLRLDLGADAQVGVRRIEIIGSSTPNGLVRVLAA